MAGQGAAGEGATYDTVLDAMEALVCGTSASLARTGTLPTSFTIARYCNCATGKHCVLAGQPGGTYLLVLAPPVPLRDVKLRLRGVPGLTIFTSGGLQQPSG